MLLRTCARKTSIQFSLRSGNAEPWRIDIPVPPPPEPPTISFIVDTVFQRIVLSVVTAPKIAFDCYLGSYIFKLPGRNRQRA